MAGGLRPARKPRFGTGCPSDTEKHDSESCDDAKRSLCCEDVDHLVVCLRGISAPLDSHVFGAAICGEGVSIAIQARSQDRVVRSHTQSRIPELKPGLRRWRAHVAYLADSLDAGRAKLRRRD